MPGELHHAVATATAGQFPDTVPSCPDHKGAGEGVHVPSSQKPRSDHGLGTICEREGRKEGNRIWSSEQKLFCFLFILFP